MIIVQIQENLLVCVCVHFSLNFCESVDCFGGGVVGVKMGY